MTTIRLALVALALVPALAQAQAARVLLAVGDVVAVRAGQEVRLAPGTAIQSGDTIRVGPASNAQIRMSDESIVALRERTVFRIDEYSYSGQVDGSEKSFFSLLAGGMRTVTGAIGRLKRLDKYAVRTATATIGIRGTHYTLRECNEQSPCNPTSVSKGGHIEVASASLSASDVELVAQLGAPGQGAPFGTYGGVTDGAIGVSNDTPEQEFAANQYFYVASRQTAPQALIGPPPFLFDRLEGQSRTKGQKGRESGETLAQGGINAESRPSDVPPAPKPSEFIVTEQKTPTGGSAVVGTVNDTGALGYWVSPGASGPEGGGALIPQTALTLGAPLAGFRIPEGCIGPNEDCTGAPSGTLGAPAQSGSATFPGSTQMVFWGRWNSGTITDSGQTFSLSSTNQGHFMFGPLTPDTVIASKSGSLVLQSSFPGFGTTPTNSLGELASGATFPQINVDFTARTAYLASAASISFPSESWSLNSTAGSPSAIQIAGGGAFFRIDTTGTCSGLAPGGCNYPSVPVAANGRAAGIFLGPAGDHAGVVLSGVSGTARFGTVRVYCPTC